MSMIYRKKPVLVSAMCYDGTSECIAALSEWTGEQLRWSSINETLTIETLEGNMVANIGDWIICGVRGEFYPCKPDIFDATYEPAGRDGLDYQQPTKEPT